MEDQARQAHRIESLEVPTLALAGLAILLYLADLLGLWALLGLSEVYRVTSLVIDLVFVVDLLMKVVILRMNYIKSPWFVIDLISSVPALGSLAALPGAGQGLRFVRSFRLFRILRTLRTLRILRTLKAFQSLPGHAQPSVETRAFHRALVISVLIYTALFVCLVSFIYSDGAQASLATAQQMEFYLVLGSLLGMMLVVIVVRYQLTEVGTHQVRALLNVALPSQVAEHFMKHPEDYHRTVRMPATVIFCDIRGFTKTVETLGGDLVTLKSHLEISMDAVTDVHRRYDLIIDKFIGDAIMSFRGGDLVTGGPEEHAWRVVRASLDGMEALRKLDDPYFRRMKIGGASADDALIGAFGTSSRLSYTILGDRVNLAARLEAASGQCGTGNLFCARTYELTQDRQDIVWRRFGKLQVQGKQESVDVYEAFDPQWAQETDWIDCYHGALELYEAGDFSRARDGFLQADSHRDNGDPPAQMFAVQCDHLMKNGCPDDWSPVFVASK